MTLLLILLFIKHWVVDFILQTERMVFGKGIYGNIHGICHSLQHAIVTTIILLHFTQSIPTILTLSIIELIIHYHTDFIKMKFGNGSVNNKMFWVHLGLVQLVNSLNYILIAHFIG